MQLLVIWQLPELSVSTPRGGCSPFFLRGLWKGVSTAWQVPVPRKNPQTLWNYRVGVSQSKFILVRAAPEWKSRKSALPSFALLCCCLKHLGSRGCLRFQLLIKHNHIAGLFSEAGTCSSFKELLRTEWRAQHWLRRLQRKCRSSVTHSVLLLWEFSRQWMLVVWTHNFL